MDLTPFYDILEELQTNISSLHAEAVRLHHHSFQFRGDYLASRSLLRRKTAITEMIGGHKFCSFFECCHCIGSRAKMIVFRRPSLTPGRSGRSYENPLIAFIAYHRLSRLQSIDAIEMIGAII